MITRVRRAASAGRFVAVVRRFAAIGRYFVAIGWRRPVVRHFLVVVVRLRDPRWCAPGRYSVVGVGGIAVIGGIAFFVVSHFLLGAIVRRFVTIVGILVVTVVAVTRWARGRPVLTALVVTVVVALGRAVSRLVLTVLVVSVCVAIGGAQLRQSAMQIASDRHGSRLGAATGRLGFLISRAITEQEESRAQHAARNLAPLDRFHD